MCAVVLYSIEHGGHILNLLYHRLIVHSDDSAVLLVNTAQANSLRSLNFNQLFEKVLFYNGDSFYKCNSEIETIEKMNCYFTDLLRKNNIDLGLFSKIYVQGDCLDPLAVYLSISKIDCVIMESSTGDFRNKWKYEQSYKVGTISVYYYNLQKRYCVLCAENRPSVLYGGENGFDYDNAPKALSENDKKLVFECFNVCPDSFNTLPDNLLLTNSSGSTSLILSDRYELSLMYQIMCDYFVPVNEKILIKPHPQFEDISIFFPTTYYEKRTYDVALFNLSATNFKRVISIKTTSLSKIPSKYNSSISLGYSFFKYFAFMDGLFFVSRILKMLRISSVSSVLSNDKLFYEPLTNVLGIKIKGLGNSRARTLLSIFPNFDLNFDTYIVLSETGVDPPSYPFRYKLNLYFQSFYDSSVVQYSYSINIFTKRPDFHEKLLDFSSVFYSKYRLGSVVITSGGAEDALGILSQHADSKQRFLSDLSSSDCAWLAWYQSRNQFNAGLVLNGVLGHNRFSDEARDENDYIKRNASQLTNVQFLLKECSRGIPEAHYLLADYYLKNDLSDLEFISKNLKLSMPKLTNAVPKLFDVLWRIATEEAYAEAFLLAKKHADMGDSSMMGRLARAYRDGKGTTRNLDEAAKWMRKASRAGISWASDELFDILWSIGTENSLSEMIEVIQPLADAGNGESIARLGKAYFIGKGVKQDYSKSAALLRLAVDKRVSWAVPKLFDVLWRIATEDAYAEAFLLAKKHADMGDSSMMGRLARAYRDGRGINSNYGKAAYWMCKSASFDHNWVDEYLSIERQLFLLKSKSKKSRICILNLEHSGFLFDLINYSTVNYPGYKLVLLLDVDENNIDYERLSKVELFDAVIPFSVKNVYKNNSLRDIEYRLFSLFAPLIRQYYSENLVVFHAIDNNNPFGIFCTLLGLKSTILETIEGQSLNVGRYEHRHAIKSISDEYYCLQKDTGSLCGGGMMDVITYGANTSERSFDYVGAYKSVPPAVVNSILQYVPLDLTSIPPNSQLIIANSPGFLSGCKVDKRDFPIIYPIVADMYSDSSLPILIKLHPHQYKNKDPLMIDVLGRSGVSILDSSFNIDVVSYTDLHLNSIIYVSSTAVNKISRNADNLICASDFYRNYKQCLLLLSAASIVKMIGPATVIDKTKTGGFFSSMNRFFESNPYTKITFAKSVIDDGSDYLFIFKDDRSISVNENVCKVSLSFKSDLDLTRLEDTFYIVCASADKRSIIDNYRGNILLNHSNIEIIIKIQRIQG